MSKIFNHGSTALRKHRILEETSPSPPPQRRGILVRRVCDGKGAVRVSVVIRQIPLLLTVLSLLSSLSRGEEPLSPTLSLIATIPTGIWPKGVGITPDGTKAYVTNFYEGSLTIIDTATKTVLKTIKIKGAPVEVAFRKDRPEVWVSDFSHHRVLIFDTTNDSLIGQVKVELNPKVLCFTPDGKKLLVSNWSSHSVSIIDTDSGKVCKTIGVEVNPRGIDITPDGRYAYIANFSPRSNSVSVIDLKKEEVIATIKGFRNRPRHIKISPDGKYAYVSLFSSGKIFVMDTATNQIVKRIDLGGSPRTFPKTPSGQSGGKVRGKPKSMVFSPDGKYLYIANFGANRLDILEVNTDSIICSIPAGKNPCGIDVTPDGKYVYLTNWSDNNVMVFEVNPAPR